jgi:purine-binding chemotaxis protein CheW
METRGQRSLICRVAARLCALPLGSVIETMRALPVKPVAGAPDFVLGLSIVRGEPVPVVHAALLLAEIAQPPTRYVSVRVGERRAIVAVDEVIGVRELQPEALDSLPPLLESRRSVVTGLGTLDRELLCVLDTARIVPDEVWLMSPGASA